MTEQQPLQVTDVNDSAGSSAAQPSDVNTNADSSQPAQTSDVSQPSSSDGKGVKSEPKSLKDLISDGIDKITGKGKSTEAPTADGEKPNENTTDPNKVENQDGEDDADSDKIEATEEVLKHPKVKAIMRERKKARVERDEALRQVETFKKDAGSYQQIRTFLSQNGVPDVDAGKALKMAAMYYKQPEELFKELSTLYVELGQRLGHILPPDLQNEVDTGLISVDRAKQLVKLRGQTLNAHEQITATREQLGQRQQQDEYNFRVQLFTKWQENTVRTEPDLQKKMPMVLERVKFLLDSEGDPANAQEAYDRLNRALTDVNQRLQGFAPPRTGTRPSPNPSAPGVSGAEPPRSFDEAMARAVQGVFSNP